MKLLRIGTAGSGKPAMIDQDGAVRDLLAQLSDVSGDVLPDASLARVREIDLGCLPVVDPPERIEPCVGHVGEFICIGLSHADHAAEGGMSFPDEPAIFLEARPAICDSNDDVEISRISVRPDWEVEFGVVVGERVKHVSEEGAMDQVAGRCVVDDLSERDFQLGRSGQRAKANSANAFGPIGPWLVTGDEAPDPRNQAMHLDANGHRCQVGSARTVHFGVAAVVSLSSRFMGLQPGGFVSAGMPPGVELGRSPQACLNPGDVMELGSEGQGTRRQGTGAAQ